MKIVIYQIFIFLIFNIQNSFAATCQNDGNQDLLHNYDILKLIKKSAEHVNISQSLKLISGGDEDFVKEFEKSLQVSIKPEFLLDLFSEVTSNKCIEDLKYVFENLLSPGGWALKMLDSYGKPESGILVGHIKWLGSYDECVNIQVGSQKDASVGNFRGKYCTFQVPLSLGPVSLPISTALCLPDSCNPNGTIASILQYKRNGSFSIFEGRLESMFTNATLNCKSPPKKLTTGAIVVICLLSVFAVLAVIGSSITAFEYYLKLKLAKKCECDSNAREKAVNSTDVENVSQGETDDITLLGAEEKKVLPAYIEKCKPFFNCFCIFTNGEKILNTASSEGQLPSLHGIRFLSMTWVILCHTYATMASIVNDTADAIDLIDRWTFQVILNGFFSVDSFFVLSGFLVGYLFFQQAQKTDGKIPWLYFYIHRYIRLTPVYMIVLAFYTTLSPFLGSGPLWPDYDVIDDCKNNWWWNVLYINNFQPMNSQQCMGWSWYLANDMQFYVISPLFLISLWRWPKIGYSLLGLFFWITFACNFVLTYEYDIIAGFGNILEFSKDMTHVTTKITDFFDKIYGKPYARIGPYLVGLLLAYYVCKRKWNKSPNLSWVTLSVGWIVASGITLACQFGLYHQDLTTLAAAFYNALSRTGFALGLGWLIFVCVIGQGGVVNSILSWKALIPLSRLTYCAYLIHLIVVSTYFSSVRTLTNFSHINVIMLYLGILVISYAAAMVTSLLFESPVIRLERLIRNKLAS